MIKSMLKYACIISFLLALSSCTNTMNDVMALPDNKVRPSQIGDSVTLLYTDSAQLKIMLKANRMLMFDKNVTEPFTVMPKGVFVTFFDEDEKVSATLRANYGVRYDVSKRMEARYAVEVVNKEGTKLETEKLIWNENTQRIYTDAPVKITTATEVITGHGMESNQDFTQYELKKVTGTFRLNN
ncbi:MAG: LPS export ABC transporter periplasmic protein LptC [Bacteroidetes bacterium]|nr:LPS export ABC transporter periplasmic protein LptC [Bacteroidota bacterium]